MKVPNVLSNKIGTSGLNSVACANKAHSLVQLSHLHRHSSLTSAWIASEHVVQGWNVSFQAHRPRVIIKS